MGEKKTYECHLKKGALYTKQSMRPKVKQEGKETKNISPSTWG